MGSVKSELENDSLEKIYLTIYADPAKLVLMEKFTIQFKFYSCENGEFPLTDFNNLISNLKSIMLRLSTTSSKLGPLPCNAPWNLWIESSRNSPILDSPHFSSTAPPPSTSDTSFPTDAILIPATNQNEIEFTNQAILFPIKSLKMDALSFEVLVQEDLTRKPNTIYT